jgi:DNA mismatch repair protein MutL
MTGYTDEQAKVLLEQLFERENYSFSPSGKAIMAEITPEFIKSKLG